MATSSLTAAERPALKITALPLADAAKAMSSAPQPHRSSPRRKGSRIRHGATHRNHVRSYDFLADRTEGGRQLKLLVAIDEFTRECLAIEVGGMFTPRDVILTLQYLFAVGVLRNTLAATTDRNPSRRRFNAG